MAKDKQRQVFIDPTKDFPLDTPEKIRRADVATSFHLATKPLKTFGEKAFALIEGGALFIMGIFGIIVSWVLFSDENVTLNVGGTFIFPIMVIIRERLKTRHQGESRANLADEHFPTSLPD